jgi:UDP-2-acetamido-2,6-beta-L-arabino-hexul-4-ose reductase
VNDSKTLLTLVYIDDLVKELINALSGNENRVGEYCEVPVTYSVTLGEIASLLESFKALNKNEYLYNLTPDSFEKKLLSAYLSYLPSEKAVIDLKSNTDERGSFTELVHTLSGGQISVNISKPGITKGQHWHNSKWELFIVIKGEALIQQRRIGTDEIREYRVSGDKLQAVCMLPGFTHNIINLSETEELITLMWANENFDKQHPDTFREAVE